ncbi:hypothetical protein [Streptomyces sp. NPDC001492]
MTVTADLAPSLDGCVAGTNVAVGTFVLTRAKAAADRNVGIAGGASTVQQCLGEGPIDELQLPVVHLEPVRVVDTPLATHRTYRLGR